MSVRGWERRVCGEGKAGDEGRAYYKVDGTNRKTGRTKGAVSQGMSGREIEVDLTTPREERV